MEGEPQNQNSPSYRSIPPPPSSRPARAVASGIDRLAYLQGRKPWVPILFVVFLAVLGGWLATRLQLRTRFDQLLPDSQPSVLEMRRVTSKTVTAQSVMIVLEGNDNAVLRALGDQLVVEIGKLDSSVVSYVEDGIQKSRSFLQPRAGLFGKVEDLQKLHDDVEARWDWEVGQATGTGLDDPAPPPIDAAEMKKRFGGDGKKERFKDGYYQSEDGHQLVVVIRTPIVGGDLDRSEKALDRIVSIVSSVKSAKPEYAQIQANFAGDLTTSITEYGAIRKDLLEVGVMGIGFVLAVVLLYFARLRALLVMGITIACGLAWTFGLTKLVIGHLNIATGFLFSIVAGNGINVGILYLSRYYEERRAGRSARDAITVTHKATWQATFVAAVTAAAAYMSLSITDFRAFKHFAFIGAAGMLTCWVVTILLLPALLIVFDANTDHTKNVESAHFLGRLRNKGISYGGIFSALVPKAPRVVVAVGIAIGVLGTWATVRYAKSDPMEYDLRKVQNDPAAGVEMYHASDVANRILGEYKSAMVVLVDHPEQARELEQVLQARWDAAKVDEKPFEGVHTLYDFVPQDQAAKIPVLLDTADRIRRAHVRGWVKEADWNDLQPILPPDGLQPFGIAELPDDLARSFTEKNGTRGTLVLIQPTVAEDPDNLHYLIRYADSFRETPLPSGYVARGSGRAVIFADILKAVTTDIPKAVTLSLVMTFVTVMLTFRRGVFSLSVFLALFVGLAGVGLYLYIAGIRINFLNFAALPITFGIGVDYAVNLMQRYHADGHKKIRAALETTGGAVVLCSMTTILGYLALIKSHNQAIRSLGTVAVMGEVSCLLAAVVVLPAGWYWIEQREKNARLKADPLQLPPPPSDIV